MTIPGPRRASQFKRPNILVAVSGRGTGILGMSASESRPGISSLPKMVLMQFVIWLADGCAVESVKLETISGIMQREE